MANHVSDATATLLPHDSGAGPSVFPLRRLRRGSRPLNARAPLSASDLNRSEADHSVCRFIFNSPPCVNDSVQNIYLTHEIWALVKLVSFGKGPSARAAPRAPRGPQAELRIRDKRDTTPTKQFLTFDHEPCGKNKFSRLRSDSSSSYTSSSTRSPSLQHRWRKILRKDTVSVSDSSTNSRVRPRERQCQSMA
ncbi:hypothetical protein EVAR_39867_1 [Eumeta japonica]|uniref:Uncharacterized protein n=1 Tax=Eumeta variegata TaxID=151549 RepID=A0A4C1WRY2_EUMVA|nr:hypothetical protein EVAR_39867_1 [Eumeta japonica]